MINKIFNSILITSAAVLIASLVIITSFLYEYFAGIQARQLTDELTIASTGMELAGEEYLGALNYDNFRLTWIAANGEVLFDSQADSNEMDNHLGREEIAEAFETGRGASYRYSSTLTEKTLYEAVLLSDGSVLRISVDRASGFSIAMGMLYPIIIVMVIAVIVSAVLAHAMSKKIIEPLNKLDLDNPMENDIYAEIAPLLGRIHRQNMKIERKAAELKCKKDEFDFITGNMREGLVLLDRNMNILAINPAAISIFGADEHCIGQGLVSICRRHSFSSAVEKAVLVGQSEARAVFSDRELQFDISRIDTNGERVGAVILAVDITEQADAERARREFTANVSHELKTPLQSIMGSAELIENGLVKSEDMPRFVGHIREEAKRLVALVEDIIRLSQLDEQSEMPREAVSLYELTEEAFSSLDASAELKNISLNIKGERVVINCVRQLIFEVIYNLCDNAVRYTPDGGRVIVEISESEKAAVLTVSDNGIGIAPEYQPRIFERFYRVDKSHSKSSGGTGLGLSIVKHAVIYHGGKISLNSAVGKGTSITVTLPKSRLM